MSKELVIVKPSLFELETTNDIYMTLKMCILTNQANLNNALFTDDFIDGVLTNKDKYIGIPLVASRSKLENGQYSALSHEYNKKTGELETDQIGSFVDFWDETDSDGTRLLMGEVRIQKRFSNVCDAISELYDLGELEFSCEVLVFGYSDVTGKIRSISYTYEEATNELFGSCVVNNPAEPKSKATMLVAEALSKDLEGGEPMSVENKNYNNDNKIEYHGSIEIASLTYDEISAQIYNQLNPVDPKTTYRDYEYYICDLYNDFVIVADWDGYNELYKIAYQVVNDVVVLDPEDSWIKGSKGFIPDSVNSDDTMPNEELASIVVAQKEEKVKMNEELELLKTEKAELARQIEELLPFKNKVESAEKQALKDVLVEKFSKLLSEEALKTDEVIKAFEELDEVTLNSVVVAEVSKEIANKSPQKKDGQVIVNARNNENLIPSDRRTKLYAEKTE